MKWFVERPLAIRLLLVLTTTIVVWVAAVAASATTLEDVTLKGPIDRGGRAKIAISSGKVQGTPVDRYRWEFRRISVRCSGRRETARRPVEGEVATDVGFDQVGNHWGTGVTATGPAGTYETRLSGRLVTRKKARGWVRVFGTAVGIQGGGHESCDSGRLHGLHEPRTSAPRPKQCSPFCR